MRLRWLILVLVLLLPMRLWAGQLMSTVHASTLGMAASAEAYSTSGAMHAACHGQSDATAHAAEAANPSDSPEGLPDAPHHTCDHCQLCHGGALAMSAWLADLPAASLPNRAALQTPTASADLALLLKPPIS